MAWNLTSTYRLSARMGGIAAITFAVFLLSLSDALVKFAGDRFGLAQIVLLRSLIAGCLIGAAFMIMSGSAALRAKQAKWVWARSVSLTAMWLSYYAALPSMSFALAAACYYTSPIWMALMARFLLGATVGRRGWTAIGLSTLGVALVVTPSDGKLTPVILLPLAAAMFYALAGTITWSRCQNETAGAMALNLNICLCVVAGLGLLTLSLVQQDGGDGFVLSMWHAMCLADWSLAALLGCFMAIIATAVALAYRLAPTPIVGVFDTSYLGFAALWSVIFFADIPDGKEAIGISLIASGGILMSRRPASQDEDTA